MRTALALIILAVTPALCAAQDRMSEALRKGIAEEEAGRNLNAAIQQYESVLLQYDAARKTAATALFRMAESYRKQGKAAEAKAAYSRVIREFGDQAKLVAESRRYLPQEPAAQADITDARRRYRDTLEAKVKLAEEELKKAQHQLELGTAEPPDIARMQISVLSAQQALAEYDQDRTVARKLLMSQIEVARLRLQYEQRRRELGVENSEALTKMQRALLELQAQLAKLDAAGQIR